MSHTKNALTRLSEAWHRNENLTEVAVADYAPENWQPAQIAWVRNHPAFLLGLKQTLHANRLIPNLLKSLAFTGTFAQYIQQPEIEKEIVTSLLQRSAKPETKDQSSKQLLHLWTTTANQPLAETIAKSYPQFMDQWLRTPTLPQGTANEALARIQAAGQDWTLPSCSPLADGTSQPSHTPALISYYVAAFPSAVHSLAKATTSRWTPIKQIARHIHQHKTEPDTSLLIKAAGWAQGGHSTNPNDWLQFLSRRREATWEFLKTAHTPELIALVCPDLNNAGIWKKEQRYQTLALIPAPHHSFILLGATRQHNKATLNLDHRAINWLSQLAPILTCWKSELNFGAATQTKLFEAINRTLHPKNPPTTTSITIRLIHHLGLVYGDIGNSNRACTIEVLSCLAQSEDREIIASLRTVIQAELSQLLLTQPIKESCPTTFQNRLTHIRSLNNALPIADQTDIPPPLLLELL